jgi:hypothetical protein
VRSVDQLTALRKTYGVVGDLSNPHQLRGMLLDLLEENAKLETENGQLLELNSSMRRLLDERN